MSSSSNSDEQYEGGGTPVGGVDSEKEIMKNAQDMFQVLLDKRTSKTGFDFIDPQTKQPVEFEDENGETKSPEQMQKEVQKHIDSIYDQIERQHEKENEDLNMSYHSLSRKKKSQNNSPDKLNDDVPSPGELGSFVDGPPGKDEYLVWEPSGLFQKIKNFFFNMMEMNLVITVTMLALKYPSVHSAWVFVCYNLILWPMTMKIRSRFLYDIVCLAILLVFNLIQVFFKLKLKVSKKEVFLGKSVAYDNLIEYRKDCYTLLDAGFIFKKNVLVFNPDVKSSKNQTISELDFIGSFYFEIIVIALNIFMMVWCMMQHRKIQKLYDTPENKLIQYINLLDPRHDEDEEDDRIDEQVMNNMGTSEVIADRNSGNTEQEQAQELKKFKKEISMNFIGSNRFYNWNQTFYGFSIIFTLLESVSFNSCSSLPGIFLVILLSATYDLRKRYSYFYRTLSFVVGYYIHYLMIIKLTALIYMDIKYLNVYLVHHPKDNRSIFLQAFFGKLKCITDKDYDQEERSTRTQYVSLLIAFYVSAGWKAAKWFEIRDKTSNLQTNMSLSRFTAYITERAREDRQEQVLVQLGKAKVFDDSGDKKEDEKLKAKKLRVLKKSQRYDANKVQKKVKKHNNNLSAIILFLAQVNMFFMAYLYHSSAGFFCLCWLILSLILQTQTILFISMIVMVPILSWMFIFIYAMRIPSVNQISFFQMNGKYFQVDLAYESWEQLFMILTLLLFYMQISCYIKRIDDATRENGMLVFFRTRIIAKNVTWIWVFLASKHVQIVVLVFFFFRGIQKLNAFNNLGYLFFFVLYTAYQQVYRQTGFLLVIFVSIFILGQYFMSLYYQIYMHDDQAILDLYWWNIFPHAYQQDDIRIDPFHIKNGESQYGIVSPQLEDWISVVLMYFLNDINVMYKNDKGEVEYWQKECYNVLEEKMGKVNYYFSRVNKIAYGILTYVIIFSMIFVQGLTQASIITWIFMALNLINMAFMIKGSSTAKFIKMQLNISNFVKFYAFIVIIMNVMVLTVMQEIEQSKNPHMIRLNNLLPIIGLKASTFDKKIGATPAEKTKIEQEALKGRMLAMVIFFLCSIYLCNHFTQKLKIAKGDEDFREEDYKNMFEFHDEQIDDDCLRDRLNFLKLNPDAQDSPYKRYEKYFAKDLIEFYEAMRFSVAFIVYRKQNWWSTLDLVALFSNIGIAGIYMYLALFVEVNLAMALQICVLCFFFTEVVNKVGVCAKNVRNSSGIQTQVDLKMAQLITKQYKSESYAIFLHLRRRVWNIQFIILIVTQLIQYPTPLLQQIKNLKDDKQSKDSIDMLTLCLFYLGLYREKTNLNITGLLLTGLIIERISINWLKNRFGCTYFKLQKFIELDQRREALRYRWDIVNPIYSVNSYKKHYFLNDFNEIKERMRLHTYKEFIEEKKLKRARRLADAQSTFTEPEITEWEKQAEKMMFGDFVPHKVGGRMIETIKFTIKVNCRASDFDLDKQSIDILQLKSSDYDYESVPVLQKYKTEQLRTILTEAVGRKYKISFFKGQQIVLEAFIMFLLMISLMLKANVWSLIYLIFLYKFVITRNKTQLYVRICSYLSISLGVQYIVYLLNMTWRTSPSAFPKVFTTYPATLGAKDLNGELFLEGKEKVPKLMFPLFFHFRIFRDQMSLAYMLGIGVDQQQVHSLVFDFINIYLMTMYIFAFRNPILSKQVSKIFWQFPNKDDLTQWMRLEKVVQRQVDWMFNPTSLYKDKNTLNHKYSKVGNDLSKTQKKTAEAQYKFAQDYNSQNKYDLNYYLANYVDLKYQTIWGDDFLKEKKWELKKNSSYFRLVKQGSQLAYISFHIITIFVVLLMAAMRQSIFSIGYMFILIFRMADGAEVLKQRDFEQKKELEDLDDSIFEIKDQLQQKDVTEKITQEIENKLLGTHLDETQIRRLSSILKMTTQKLENLDNDLMQDRDEMIDIVDYERHANQLMTQLTINQQDVEILMVTMVRKYRRLSGEAIQELLEQLAVLKKKSYKLSKSFQSKNSKKTNQEKAEMANQQWKMISVIQRQLLIYGIIDFTIQILYQMPILSELENMDLFGFRKIWTFPNNMSLNDIKYHRYISANPSAPHYMFHFGSFAFESMNCLIIAFIILQSEIFSSHGYNKYVTQNDGSMDLLIQLSKLKAKSITFVHNNYKIRKILNIQRKRESILKTVEKLKDKIARWRQFTRTTLVNTKGPSGIEQDDDNNINEKNEQQNEQIKWSLGWFQNLKTRGMLSKMTGKVRTDAIEADGDTIKTKKKVMFSQDDEQIVDKNQIDDDAHQSDELEEVDPFYAREEKKLAEKKLISPEEKNKLFRDLGEKFVNSKISKMRWSIRIYLWLNKTFTEQIMFKNQKAELEILKLQHAAGHVEIPTELESLMKVEAQELITQYYDHSQGLEELTILLAKNKNKGEDILTMTAFDKRIKLTQMKNTWEFTRPFSMFVRYLETLFHIMISQSQNMVYFAMILSMYENAGLVSIFYPVCVFGYAILEEKRPKKQFWIMVRQYTVCLLIFKFIMNLQCFDSILQSESFIQYSAWVKIGIYNFNNIGDLIVYMIPEILILCAIMLHEIKLQLLGLYDEIEEEIEPVLDGIERNVQKGDEEAVMRKKLETQNMQLARYYESTKDQVNRRNEFEEQEKENIKTEMSKMSIPMLRQNYEYILRNKRDIELRSEEVKNEFANKRFEEEFPEEDNLASKQSRLLNEICHSVYKSSEKFDLDSKGKKTGFDEYIREKVIQKSLEADTLIFVEGTRPSLQPNFLTRHQFKLEEAKEENWDALSAGDHKVDFEEKFDSIHDRIVNNPGFFEKHEYFDRIFPSLKVQKPGFDLYGSTTTVLGIIGIYIFWNFENYSFSQMSFEFAKGQSVIFVGEMAITVIGVLIIIIIERYANRSDTKKIEEKNLVDENKTQGKAYFGNDDMFKRSTTQRSMTVKLKTVKTSDLDLASDAAQHFLSSFNNEEDDDDIEDSRTKITNQQKTKYFMHWFILVFSHLYVFWLIPIQGNYKLYGMAACDEDQKKFYFCKNFKNNGYLRGLYFLFLLYLVLSGKQLAYGFPILKKPSSVLQYYNDLGIVISNVYMAIPFLVEIRCLLDFIFSKTSLDIFQYWQLFNYHFEMYLGWVGNRWYLEKTLGEQTGLIDKCIFGVAIASVVLFLLIGPFYIFSSYSPWVKANPVLSANLMLNLLVKKQVYADIQKGHIYEDIPQNMNRADFQNFTSQIPYNIYRLTSPYIKTFDKAQWNQSRYSNKTETRDFLPKQVQFCILRQHSDMRMGLSKAGMDDLKDDIKESFHKDNKASNMSISLQFDFKFMRENPVGALEAYLKENRTLNYTEYNDCQTGKELEKFAGFTCGNIKDKTLSTSVIFTQAFNPALVLGQNNWISQVTEKQVDYKDLLHDVKLSYFCDQTWDVRATLRPTNYSKSTQPGLQVDPLTCKLINPKAKLDKLAEEEKQWFGFKTNEQYHNYKRQDGQWSNLLIILLSMKVATGFIAAYTPTTFYIGLVYVLGGQARVMLLFSTWKAYAYEVTSPEPMMKLIECCYMMRHEENLIAEEECYRMLQEIVRQPQLYKELSGSNLIGSMHPDLDTMKKKDKDQLKHLDKLERKGWDVALLKEKIVKGQRKLDHEL